MRSRIFSKWQSSPSASATGLLHVEERATSQRFALRQHTSDPGRRFLRKLLDGVVELRGPARTSPSALLTQTFKTLSCARYRYGLKQIGVLRLRLGGISAHAPCWRAGSLIQSALYPRHASNIVCGSEAPGDLRPVSACRYRATFLGLSCLRSFALSQPVLSRVDRSAWCSSSLSVGADPHLVSLCSWNCSSKARTRLFEHGPERS